MLAETQGDEPLWMKFLSGACVATIIIITADLSIQAEIGKPGKISRLLENTTYSVCAYCEKNDNIYLLLLGEKDEQPIYKQLPKNVVNITTTAGHNIDRLAITESGGIRKYDLYLSADKTKGLPPPKKAESP
ncbi:MAG: hypothetical protein M1338_01330 [Patescibacteria group bacterium]|nr:hypothetical protein [Patescibacteria group bacterium]